MERAESVSEETFVAIADLSGWTVRFGLAVEVDIGVSEPALVYTRTSNTPTPPDTPAQMANFSFPVIKMLVHLLQDHYPERLGVVYVVNMPWAFRAAWRIILPLLDERTKSKIVVLGTEFAQLQNIVPKDQLEKAYGGLHEAYPTPDPIVQEALDREARETATAAGAAGGASPGAASSSPSVSSLSPGAKSMPPRKKSKIGRATRTMKKLLRHMRKTHEAEEATLSEGGGSETDSPMVSPTRKATSALRSGGGLRFRMKSRRGYVDDEDDSDDEELSERFTSEMSALRETTERSVAALEAAVESQNTAVQRLQIQIHALMLVLLAMVGWLVLDMSTSATGGGSAAEL